MLWFLRTLISSTRLFSSRSRSTIACLRLLYSQRTSSWRLSLHQALGGCFYLLMMALSKLSPFACIYFNFMTNRVFSFMTTDISSRSASCSRVLRFKSRLNYFSASSYYFYRRLASSLPTTPSSFSISTQRPNLRFQIATNFLFYSSNSRCLNLRLFFCFFSASISCLIVPNARSISCARRYIRSCNYSSIFLLNKIES